jgi:FHS family L-fucose permease-like MFS transporter
MKENNTMENKNSISKLLPVLFAFFVMGLADLVGIATNYVKQDFGLSDTLANLLPFSLFLWFGVLSVPVGMLTTKLGRKNTVLMSILISIIGLGVSFVSQQFETMLIAFALIGIGNTIIQVSLNPLMTNVVSIDRLTSSLTLGQFIKALAAFSGPLLAGMSATMLGNWRYTFLIFGCISILSAIWLALTPIAKEEKSYTGEVSIKSSFVLLRDNSILLFFLAIVFVVGVDVGLNTAIPKFIMERCSIPLEQAGLGTSLYFFARTAGTLLGAIFLVKYSSRSFFLWGMILAMAALVGMLFSNQLWVILAMISILGLSVANVFSIVFSAALKKMPNHTNEISGLMIMGVAGGAVFPIIMGLVSDSFGQVAGMSVLVLAIIYLLLTSFKLEK